MVIFYRHAHRTCLLKADVGKGESEGVARRPRKGDMDG